MLFAGGKHQPPAGRIEIPCYQYLEEGRSKEKALESWEAACSESPLSEMEEGWLSNWGFFGVLFF